ncbi:MAG: serine acetyltransferase [Ruminococcus sp.]|nr:serine acetyltransferase [Ruminococcus sp.]MDE5583088.1 serine acetyltransferase [Ruminococcus sp.]MDE5772148.1 serine acetyltransferase [Ruminococcus sp.]MDE6426889.1 serine acetyltransferase [Ruminococcus sp.]
MGKLNQDKVDHIVQSILHDYEDNKYINHTDLYNQPDKKAIIEIVKKLLKILYPGYYSDKVYKIYSLRNNMSAAIEDIIFHLNKQIMIVLRYCFPFMKISASELEEKAENMTFDFMEKIPQMREYLETDIQAAYDGDPAAESKAEIILSYPGLYAISIYRIAHELSLIGVPMIPRIMSEYAHSTTGIDIHPGAVIGKYFFIDHGTGVVIGETTVIGEHVKIYQGVTLGGLSTKGGQNLKGVKRHPTIKDNVTIYSGSSILGGDTVIEEDVVIGGNTFVTESVAKGTRVTVKAQELQFK